MKDNKFVARERCTHDYSYKVIATSGEKAG
jgi:hypothetical protein